MIVSRKQLTFGEVKRDILTPFARIRGVILCCLGGGRQFAVLGKFLRSFGRELRRSGIRSL